MRTKVNIELIDKDSGLVKKRYETHNEVTDATYRTIINNIKPSKSYTEYVFSTNESIGNLYFGNRDTDASINNLACNYAKESGKDYEYINDLYTQIVGPSYTSLQRFTDRIEATYVFNSDVKIPEFDTFGKGYKSSRMGLSATGVYNSNIRDLTWFYGMYDVKQGLYWGVRRVETDYFDEIAQEYRTYDGYYIFTFKLGPDGSVIDRDDSPSDFIQWQGSYNWPAQYCCGISKEHGLYSLEGKDGKLYMYKWNKIYTDANGRDIFSVVSTDVYDYVPYENTFEFTHVDSSNTGRNYSRTMYDVNINGKNIIVLGKYYIIIEGSSYYAISNVNMVFCSELESYILVGKQSDYNKFTIAPLVVTDISFGKIYTKFVDYSRIINISGVAYQSNEDSYNDYNNGSRLYTFNNDKTMYMITSTTNSIDSVGNVQVLSVPSINMFDNTYGVKTVIPLDTRINKEDNVLIIKYITYF